MGPGCADQVAMVKRVLKMARVREKEFGLVCELFFLHFLVICAFIVAKTARDGLYLSNLSATTLPYVYLGLAIWTTGAIAFYGRYLGRIPSHRALMHGLWITGLSLLLFFLWFWSGGRTPAVAFYLWLGAYGLLLVSQFWVLTNDRLNPRQARRLFGVIGAGGVLGGMIGGAGASQLAGLGGPEWLLVGAAVIHGAAAVLARRSGRRPEEAPPGGAESEGEAEPGLGRILGSPYVRLIAVTMLVAPITIAVIDYEFKFLLQGFLAGPDKAIGGLGPERAAELTTFLGYFYGFQNVVMLLVQLGLTGFLLSRLGARATSMLLPGGLLVGSLATVALPHFFLVAGTWLYGSIARVTVVRSAREFLYFPLRSGVRRQAKRLIETTVNRLAEGIAGVIILLVNGLLGGTIAQLSILITVLSALALVLERLLTRSYVSELSYSLRWMLEDRERPPFDLKEAHLVRELGALLDSPFEKRVLYALDTLREVEAEGLRRYLPALLEHRSPKVRARALELSAQLNVSADLTKVESLLLDTDDDVRMHAAYFYCILKPGDARDSMGDLLKSGNDRIRSGALQCVAAHSPQQEDERVYTIAEEFMARGSRGDRLSVAMAAGKRPGPAAIHGFLERLVHDPDPGVRRAAIRSAGTARRGELVPELIRLLELTEFREDAESSLVRYGDSVVGTLGDYLADPTAADEIRKAIPQVLCGIGSQGAADALVRVSLEEDPGFADRLLRALSRLKANNPDISVSEEEVGKRIGLEVDQYLRFRKVRWIVESAPAGEARELLVRVLWERTGQSLRRLFRVLALIYPRRETRLAYRGLMSQNARLRAQSVEYIEATISPEHKRMVMPIVERTGGREREKPEAVHSREMASLEEAIEELAGIPDPWLLAAALYLVGSLKLSPLRHIAEGSARAEHPYLREMGRWAADELAA